jgi:hypothetical protein
VSHHYAPRFDPLLLLGTVNYSGSGLNGGGSSGDNGDGPSDPLNRNSGRCSISDEDQKAELGVCDMSSRHIFTFEGACRFLRHEYWVLEYGRGR